ncbi:DUF4129 domain-containing protein [Pseudomonas sp. NCCP-436]|uniref:DUF4129 domain-containing protein n=1 Tax=Pseudomonas sp. NCCP-436 TaxID=2842481 RepID=UPI001C7FDC3C|nr:DUF4129 domain-containing protein [Pseudomonas sp. NCCP-436]GIZ11271.1 hypothetical protein NCCP436_06870 [Pseudomonas sp. NCCP-436]
MRLTEASVAIRPRTAWEAVDLGVLLARRHAGLLMASWALVTLPLFALLCALLWQYPSWVMLLFWWLKPAYERLPLYILSQALFGNVPSLKQSLRTLPRLLRPQLLASLTWRRLSLTRSFDLPVLQLEGLSGKARRQRLIVLGQRDNGAATWLTVLGVHLELILWMGLAALLYLMLPAQLHDDWSWETMLSDNSGHWLWLEHLSNLLYVLALVVWEPVYVACGFTLYLNRRTALEAWDIELTFRRLRQRLTGSAYALLLGCLVLLGTPSQNVWAETPLQASENSPDSPRLLKQPLTSQAAQQSITQLLDEPPFEHRENITRWRLNDEQQEKETDRSVLLEYLYLLLENLQLKALAQVFEVLLWGALAALITYALWRYKHWLLAFGERLGLPQRHRASPPEQLFGLELTPESLPQDVASEAEHLWAEQPRAALGLLYRALLSRLLHEQQLPLKSSHTEGEVLQLITGLQQQNLTDYSQQLTHHWQAMAYGHRLPEEALRTALCQGWRSLFDTEQPS